MKPGWEKQKKTKHFNTDYQPVKNMANKDFLKNKNYM